MDLNKIMEFEHVIQVHEDGSVTDAPDNVQAPALHTESTEDGGTNEHLESPHGTSWELLSGYTGQYGYNGPVNHPSELIDGSLAEDILATPGYYVVLTAEDPDEDDKPYGWVIAHRAE